MVDRKALIRQYKESARPMGVYRVLNTTSGRSHVASSTDVPSMLNRVRFQLEMGSHTNKELQAEWNELGPDSFVFESLDLLEPSDAPDYDPAEDLAMLEQLWRDKLAVPAKD